MSEYQNPKVFLQKPALQIDQNKFLLLKKLKITVDNVFWIRIFQIKQSLEKKEERWQTIRLAERSWQFI